MNTDNKLVDQPVVSVRKARQRLSAEDREHQIVQAAIAFFAKHGFEGSTKVLAKEMGIAQGLLYRYFPTKEMLIARVYNEMFARRWNPVWEEWLADRSLPLADRLKRYFKDYVQFILRSEWVRIFLQAGLSHLSLNQKYLARLRERHFELIASEMRHEYAIPDPFDAAAEDEEIELIWAMDASVFYIGIRKWVYNLPVPKNLDRVIEMRVDAFLAGVPMLLKQERLNTSRATGM